MGSGNDFQLARWGSLFFLSYKLRPEPQQTHIRGGV